uniref:Uncharacterized protein n=1 Tax=Glossina brevipalpis TaxID=37001 RepID=A0A1A9WE66_9MUSC
MTPCRSLLTNLVIMLSNDMLRLASVAAMFGISMITIKNFLLLSISSSFITHFKSWQHPKEKTNFERIRKTDKHGKRRIAIALVLKIYIHRGYSGWMQGVPRDLGVMGISWFQGELLLLLLVVVVVAAVVTGAFVLIFDVVECTLGAIIELLEWLVVVLVALRIGVGDAGLAFKLRNAAGGGQDTLVMVIFGVECIKRAAAPLGAGLPFINLALTVLLRRVFCRKPLTFCNSDSLRFAMLLIKARAVEELTVSIVCLT